MPTTFQAVPLSAGANGRPIAVSATTAPATLLHTADIDALDEVYLYAANITDAAVTLTIQFGGTDVSDNLVATSIPENSGPVQLAFGQRLTGGLEVRAFASVANAVNMTGVVNRIRST